MKTTIFISGATLCHLLCAGGTAFAAEPSNLCDSPEEALFSCQIGEKTLSVCASQPAAPGSGALTYRFGKSRSLLDLEYPMISGPIYEHFKFISRGDGHWADWQLSFSTEGYNYTLMTHSEELRSWQDFTALAVQKNNEAVSLRSCNRKYADVNKLYLLVEAGLPKGEYLDAVPPGAGNNPPGRGTGARDRYKKK